jgi:hypothetical protein
VGIGQGSDRVRRGFGEPTENARKYPPSPWPAVAIAVQADTAVGIDMGGDMADALAVDVAPSDHSHGRWVPPHGSLLYALSGWPSR